MKVAYQGAPGAYSEGAAAALFPRLDAVPERTFADVFAWRTLPNAAPPAKTARRSAGRSATH